MKTYKLTNENNNTNYAAITITGPADLIIQNLGSNPTSIHNGSDGNTFSCRVTNQGSAAAGSSTLKIYINSVNSLSGSPILLASTGIGSLNAGSHSDQSLSNISIPYFTGSLPQTKYIIFQADANNDVTECNESNNIGYVQVSITTPTNTDLAISGEGIDYDHQGMGCSNSITFGSSTNLTCFSPPYGALCIG